MSAEALTPALGVSSRRLSLATVRTFRYAVGSTLAIAVALGIDWQLSYLTPVLVLGFLGVPRPPLRGLISFLLIVVVASGLGVLVSSVLLPYPGVFLMVEALTLYLLFYHAARGAPALLITWLMISLTVIPVVGNQSMMLAIAVAKGIIVGAVAALVIAWVAHVVLPDSLADSSGPVAAPKTQGPLPGPHQAHRRAVRTLVVVFPIVGTYLLFGLTSVLIVVFVALLSMQPSVSAGAKAGKALIAANVLGGLGAIVIYELLVMVPQFGFLLLLILFGGLWFGSRLFGGTPTAPLFGMAFSTVLLVIGSTTSMFGDADAKAWTRVIQISTAVVYLVMAHGLLDRIVPKAETSNVG